MKPRIKIEPKTIFIMTIITIFMIGCHNKNDLEKKPQAIITSPVKENIMEPDDHFAKALETFAKGDFDKSYAEIQDGIKYMEGISSISSSDEQKKLNSSIDELCELAENVRKDKVDGIDELNYFFDRAGKALGNHHIEIVEKLIPEQATNNFKLEIFIKNLVKPVYRPGIGFNEEKNQLLMDVGTPIMEMHSKYQLDYSKIHKALMKLQSGLNSMG